MTMIGIDPHKATHTAVAVDDNEVVLDEFKLRASATQADRLRDWAEPFDKREWAIESANGLGYLIAQQLIAAGETVFDVPPVLALPSPSHGLGTIPEERSERRSVGRDRCSSLRPPGPGSAR